MWDWLPPPMNDGIVRSRRIAAIIEHGPYCSERLMPSLIRIRALLLTLALPGAFLCSIRADAATQILPCRDEGTSYDKSQCLQAARDAVDKRLDLYMQAAGAVVAADPDFRSVNLEDAQRAWVAYRTAHCGDADTYWMAGKDNGDRYARCYLSLTRERMHDLWEAYLIRPVGFNPKPSPLPEP